MDKLEKWSIQRTSVLLEDLPWLRVLSDDIVLPDGRELHNYLRLETPNYVSIAPVTDQGEFILVRSYKHGVGDIDIQTPAGYIEPDEQPKTAATRELLEETGYEASSIISLGSYVLSGNRGAGKAHLLLALGCHKVQEPDSGDLEQQQVLSFSEEEIRQMLADGVFGQISTAATLSLALLRSSAGSLESNP
jgi:ADP-ribose pyrophosphatase